MTTNEKLRYAEDKIALLTQRVLAAWDAKEAANIEYDRLKSELEYGIEALDMMREGVGDAN